MYSLFLLHLNTAGLKGQFKIKEIRKRRTLFVYINCIAILGDAVGKPITFVSGSMYRQPIGGASIPDIHFLIFIKRHGGLLYLVCLFLI